MHQDESVPLFDVIILGSGWSGLLAAKYCLGEGLTTLVLESRDSIGGVWAFTSDRRFGGVMTTTETTSSRCITEISDFPMPESYPDFPSHVEILAYLKAYCANFDLERHIRLNHQVSNAHKVGNMWHIVCADGSKFHARHVIVCSGVHQHPNDKVENAHLNHFTGQVLHSASVKEVPQNYVGKTIVIWGGGESASDITLAVSRIANRVYWCIPNGQWFVPKVVEGWPSFHSRWRKVVDHTSSRRRRKVVDHTSSRVRLFLSPTHGFSPFINQYLEYTYGFNGHGQIAWKTDAPYNRSFFNKSSEVLSRVKSGNVVPKRDIVRCNGDQVHFTDGSEVQADAIIVCSGYRLVLPFFEPLEAPSTDPRDWYKYMFWEDPSLAFIGFVRPIFGSIPGIAELQSRYAALVFAGKRTLPSLRERTRIAQADAAFWNHHFRFTSLRLRGLVDHFLYSDQLARLIGCRPRFWKLLFTNPRKWWWAISSPWNGCQFWLNDKAQHERIFATFSRYRDNQNSEVYIFLKLAPILPFIGLFSRARVFLKEHVVRHRPPHGSARRLPSGRTPDEKPAGGIV